MSTIYLSDQTDKGKAKIVRNRSYYVESDFVVFKVEDRLFKVPSHMFLTESPRFSEIFGLIPHREVIDDEDITDSGHDHQQIIYLKGIRHEDFKCLLKLLYPLQNASLDIILSKEEWISILYISSEWSFLRLREMAIDELNRLGALTAVQKVVLGRKLSISSWVEKGLRELALRKEAIQDDEGFELDSDHDISTTLKLFWLREEYTSIRTSSLGNPEKKFLELFSEEIQQLREAERGYMIPDSDEEMKKEAVEREKELAEEEKRWAEEKRKKHEEKRRREEKKKMMIEEERNVKVKQLRERMNAARVIGDGQ